MKELTKEDESTVWDAFLEGQDLTRVQITNHMLIRKIKREIHEVIDKNMNLLSSWSCVPTSGSDQYGQRHASGSSCASNYSDYSGNVASPNNAAVFVQHPVQYSQSGAGAPYFSNSAENQSPAQYQNSSSMSPADSFSIE